MKDEVQLELDDEENLNEKAEIFKENSLEDEELVKLECEGEARTESEKEEIEEYGEPYIMN